MGAVGSGFDNAMIESLWSRMPVALLDRQRRHSRLGMPVEFETRHQTETVA